MAEVGAGCDGGGATVSTGAGAGACAVAVVAGAASVAPDWLSSPLGWLGTTTRSSMYWTSVTTIGANVVVGADVVEGAAVTGTFVVELSLVTTSVGRACPSPANQRRRPMTLRPLSRPSGSRRSQRSREQYDDSLAHLGLRPLRAARAGRQEDGRATAEVWSLRSIVVLLVKVSVLQLDADRCLL